MRYFTLAAAAMLTCSSSGACAQMLDEIEAWVLEPYALPSSPPLGPDDVNYPFIYQSPSAVSASGQLAGAYWQLRPNGFIYARTGYVLVGDKVSLLPPPEGFEEFENIRSDDAGNIFAAPRATGETPLPRVAKWINGEPTLLPQPQLTERTDLIDVSRSGRVLASSNRTDPLDRLRLVVTWNSPGSDPIARETPLFPRRDADFFKEPPFIPLAIDDAGAIFGATDFSTSFFSGRVGWLLPDGSIIDAVTLRDDTFIYVDDVAIIGELHAAYIERRESASSSNRVTVLRELRGSTLSDVTLIPAGITPHRVVSNRLGDIAVSSSEGILLLSSNSFTPLATQIASSWSLADHLMVANGLLDDYVVLANSGILRPTTCLADANQDGSLDPADFDAWLNAYVATESIADQNLDRQVTPADFGAWILRYNRGCD